MPDLTEQPNALDAMVAEPKPAPPAAPIVPAMPVMPPVRTLLMTPPPTSRPMATSLTMLLAMIASTTQSALGSNRTAVRRT
jgi:hypothetical protein